MYLLFSIMRLWRQCGVLIMALTPKQIETIALYAIPRSAPLNYHKIKAALNAGLTVLATLHTSGADNTIVRDVRHIVGVKGAMQVKTLEGWRIPLRAWTKEQPELPFAQTAQKGTLLDAKT